MQQSTTMMHHPGYSYLTETPPYFPVFLVPNACQSAPHPADTPPVVTPAKPGGTKRVKHPKIRRPCNSFFLYLRDKQIEMGQVLKEKPRQNMTKIVGELWKRETEEIRSIYKAMADEIKLVHLEHYPGYKYQPEKRARKK